MKTTGTLIFLLSSACSFAEEEIKMDPKVSQVLTAVIRDVLFGDQAGVTGSDDHDRRVAIRIDRFSIDSAKNKKEKKYPYWNKSPIRISIQNAGGTKNGAVIGGRINR